MKISLVVPVYNEANILRDSIQKIKKSIEKITEDYELIIAEDGSTDGTSEIASTIAKEDSKILHIHSEKKLGRGEALKNAFRKANGNIFVYTDVDLSTDIHQLKEFVDGLNHADICIGSRLLPNSKIQRSFLRSITSKTYNFLTKLLFATSITDMQCGFKAFEKKTLPILLSTKNNHWFWDTEVLLRAERQGLKINEIPVRWIEDKGSKVRLFYDSLNFGYNLLKLRFDFINNPRKI